MSFLRFGLLVGYVAELAEVELAGEFAAEEGADGNIPKKSPDSLLSSHNHSTFI